MKYVLRCILLLFGTFILTCVGKSCPPLPGVGVQNGSYKVIDRHNIRVLCNPGYYPVGREYLRCRKGKWNQSFATKCYSTENQCPDPPKVEYADVWGDDRNVGSLVFYTCHEGYMMIGKGSRSCLSNLHWDDVSPVCLAKTSSPENVVKILDKHFLHETEGHFTSDVNGRDLGQEVFENGMELIFLIDSSSSIDPVDFKKGIAFITFIIDRFGVNNGQEKNGTRAAVITFADKAKLIFNLNDEKINLEEAKKKLRNLKSDGGGTAMEEALTLVIFDIVGAGLLRPKSKRAMFIITDAEPTIHAEVTRPADVAKELRVHQEFEIFTIGVGHDVNKVLLTEIASEPATHHVFFLEKYADFEEMLFLIRNEPVTTTRAPVTPEQCGSPLDNENSTSSSWLAAVYINRENKLHFCAGALICSQWVLTSAGCILGKQKGLKMVKTNQVFVTLGDYNLPEEEGKEINMYITDIKVSPKLNGSKNAHTRLALLKLNVAAPGEFSYQPVCLPQPSAIDIPLSMDLNTNVSLEGWGMAPSKVDSKILSAAYLNPTSKRVIMELAESSKCKKTIRKYHKDENELVKERLMCAGIGSGPSTCSGNLGSPLIAVDGRSGYFSVIGILTQYHGCANKYNIFVRLLPYINWIYRETNNCPSNHTR